MTIPKISSLLGIAQRAGFVVSGSNMIMAEAAGLKGKPKWLVVVARDALTTTGEDLIKKCLGAGLPVIRAPLDKADLGLTIGKNQRGYVMIKDSGIAGRLLELFEEMEVRPLDQSKNI
jgi:ribosomal protein L7Ae-like RNA K-turn-binding protein